MKITSHQIIGSLEVMMHCTNALESSITNLLNNNSNASIHTDSTLKEAKIKILELYELLHRAKAWEQVHQNPVENTDAR